MYHSNDQVQNILKVLGFYCQRGNNGVFFTHPNGVYVKYDLDDNSWSANFSNEPEKSKESPFASLFNLLNHFSEFEKMKQQLVNLDTGLEVLTKFQNMVKDPEQDARIKALNECVEKTTQELLKKTEETLENKDYKIISGDVNLQFNISLDHRDILGNVYSSLAFAHYVENEFCVYGMKVIFSQSSEQVNSHDYLAKISFPRYGFRVS